MTSILTSVATIKTLADLLEQLGGIVPERVRFRPPPGTATEKDVLEVEAHEDRLCELVDGVLVEKAMGWRESLLASFLITILSNFVRPRNLGLVTDEAGMVRLASGLVRIPDVAFVSWDRLPNRRVPSDPNPSFGTRSCRGSVECREHPRRNGPQAPGVFCGWRAAGLVGRPRGAYCRGVYRPPSAHGAARSGYAGG
jgi:Putative restriction endonuclease